VCGVPEIVTEQTGLLLPKEAEPETAAKSIETFLVEKSRDLSFRSGVKSYWAENFMAELNYNNYIIRHLK
jgi:hypothetical protein